MNSIIFLSFISGILTILSPCIWPLLPIVLSASIAGKSKIRPLGISLGLIITFTLSTLAISSIFQLLHLDSNIIRIIAVIIIAILGITMIFPILYSKIEILVAKMLNPLSNKQISYKNEFIPSFITGLALGVIWAPCAGPILATVAAFSALGKVNLTIILITISYAIGTAIPLFFVSLGSQNIIKRTKGLNKYINHIQQIFGLLMVITAILIYTNYDLTIQAKLLNIFPSLGTDLTGIENSNLVINELNSLKGTKNNTISDNSSLYNINTPAPNFIGITKWLNTDSTPSISSLKRKGNISRFLDIYLYKLYTYTSTHCSLV